jgi:hypothetical protein
MGRQGRGGHKTPKKRGGNLKQQSDDIAKLKAEEVIKKAKAKAARAQMFKDKEDREEADARAKRSADLRAALDQAKGFTAEAEAKRRAAVEAEEEMESEQPSDMVMATEEKEATTNDDTRQNDGTTFIREPSDIIDGVETKETQQSSKNANSSMCSSSLAKRAGQRLDEWEDQKAEALAAAAADTMSKRKDTHPPGDEFAGSRLQSGDKKDPVTSSPMKKKPRGAVVNFADQQEAEEVEMVEVGTDPEVEVYKVVSPLIPAQVDPPQILRNRKFSMLQAAKKGRTEKETAPIFRQLGQNKEGILAVEFANKVFIEPTIPPKPADYSGTHQQWAIQQFTDWFLEAQDQVGPSVSLILLHAFKSSSSELEAIKDVTKYLKGTQKSVKKYLLKFNVNYKKALAGKDYLMYLKIQMGTNVHGEDCSQLLSDLRSISPSVQVWESPLQKADVVCLGFLQNSHRNLDAQYLMQLACNIATKLSAGTCKNTLPGLHKEAFKGRNRIEVAFKWKPIWDG